MPTSESDYAQIEAARNKVSGLTKAYGETAAGATTFADDVMKNVRAAREARGVTNLQEDFGRDTQSLLGSRQRMESAAPAALDPLLVDNATAKERAFNLGNLAKIGQYEEQNAGTIEGAVQAGANTIQAQAIKQKAEAEAAQTELQNLMAIVKQKQEEAVMQLNENFRRDEMTEKTRQFEVTNNRLGKADGAGGAVTFEDPDGPAPTIIPGQRNSSQVGVPSPPMNAAVGRKVEYPPGSGNIWTSTGQGWK